MDLLFFWGMKLWGIGAFKVLFYVIMIINIIFTVIWTLLSIVYMEMEGNFFYTIKCFFYGPDLNFVSVISSFILLIGYIASIFIFPNFGYPIKSIFWTLCIFDCSVAVISIIGCLIGQVSFNGILYAIMDIIALINLNSILI